MSRPGPARAPLLAQKLDDLIEDPGVRRTLVEGRTEQRLLRRRVEPEPALARAHAVRVPGDGVDLAVVAEHPERLRALPRGRGVRGVALVEHDERRLERRVAEVRVERGQPVGRGQRLVGHGGEAAGGDVHVSLGPARERLHTMAGAVRALLGALCRVGARRAQDRLEDAGPGRVRMAPQGRGLHGHVAPVDDLQSLPGAGVLDRGDHLAGGAAIADEQHEHAQIRDGRPPDMPSSRSRNPRGIGTSTPAPSPVCSSEPNAPR